MACLARRTFTEDGYCGGYGAVHAITEEAGPAEADIGAQPVGEVALGVRTTVGECLAAWGRGKFRHFQNLFPIFIWKCDKRHVKKNHS